MTWAYFNKNMRTGLPAGPETVLTKHTVKPDTQRLHEELQLRSDRMCPCSVEENSIKETKKNEAEKATTIPH